MKKYIFRYEILIPLVLLFILWESCEKDSGPYNITPPKPPVDTTDTTVNIYSVSYADDVQHIFNDHCIQCHNVNHPFLDLRESTSYHELWISGSHAPYVDTLDPANSKIYLHLEGVEMSQMPPDPPHLTDSLKQIIFTWMAEGAHDN